MGIALATALLAGTLPFLACDPEENDDDTDTAPVAYKPNIYLYPEKAESLTVTVEFPQGGKMRVSEPAYGEGWNVKATPDGWINDSLGYLFYESEQPDVWQKDQAWVIPRDGLRGFFVGKMMDYGFRNREVTDFCQYWVPRLQNHAWYAVYPQSAELINQVIRLDFSKKPDCILRVFFVIEGLDSDPGSAGPAQPPAGKDFERKGFTVTEWGVILK